MRVLVCGDRHWDDQKYLFAVLDRLLVKHRFEVLIEGEAKGADTLAREWAEGRGITVLPFLADWKTYKKAAGPIRNRQMLERGEPTLVIAFHRDIGRSKGTASMLALAKKYLVPTLLFP